jgi:hypothetical protein
MTSFNRIVAIILWMALLTACAWLAVAPFNALEQTQAWISDLLSTLGEWKSDNSTNFIIGQAAFGISTLLFFALLIWLEIFTMRRRGVRIYTAEGGSAELDTNSVGRRLAWHLDQLAEIVTVVPTIKSRGGAVDIMLEIEAAPDVDIPFKTDEVVQLTREVVEDELGLRLGKLDVRMRCAPFDPNWSG